MCTFIVALASLIPSAISLSVQELSCEERCNISSCLADSQAYANLRSTCLQKCTSFDICDAKSEQCKLSNWTVDCTERFEGCDAFCIKKQLCSHYRNVCVGFGSGCDRKCQTACQEKFLKCLREKLESPLRPLPFLGISAWCLPTFIN